MANPINYDPNTPSVKLNFADWQIQFIQNFTQLASAFSQNHVPLNDPTVENRGNHTYIQLPQQTTDAQTGSTEFSIFSKDLENQTDQIFFTYPGNTPVVQFTNYQIYSLKDTLQQISFFTFLPGGLLIYFGIFVTFGNDKNTLFLNPPISRNIVSINLCHIGSTPKYTPAATFGTWSLDAYGQLVPGKQDIIKEIYINPNIKDTKQQAMYYCVVVNT